MIYRVINLTTGHRVGVGSIVRSLGIIYSENADTFNFETTDINFAYRYKEAMELSFIEYKY